MRLQQQQDSTPAGCAVSMNPQVTSQEVRSEKIREDFEPFVLEGLVSLDGDDVNPNTCEDHSCYLLCPVYDFGGVTAL